MWCHYQTEQGAGVAQNRRHGPRSGSRTLYLLLRREGNMQTTCWNPKWLYTAAPMRLQSHRTRPWSSAELLQPHRGVRLHQHNKTTEGIIICFSTALVNPLLQLASRVFTKYLRFRHLREIGCRGVSPAAPAPRHPPAAWGHPDVASGARGSGSRTRGHAWPLRSARRPGGTSAGQVRVGRASAIRD